MTLQGPQSTVVIDDAALKAGVLYKQKQSVLSPYFWHKIVVKNAEGERKDVVLRALMDAVRPHDFIPVRYESSGDGSVSFLLKNCGQAILRFCDMNLIVPHPETAKSYPPFSLKIFVKEMHSSKFKVDNQQNIMTILKRRYIPGKKCLDLEQFYLDKDLTEFCPLSQSKLLYFVLHLARDFDIAHLKLANNDIEILKPLEVFFGEKSAKSLVNIDLRKNKIKSIDAVRFMKVFPLVELTLEDNPICNNYKEHEYIREIINIFPNLTKLDGCRINSNGMVPLRRNFVCSYSAVELVDRFMEHYFNLYDSLDRAVLENIYHADAVFTITSQFLPGQSSSVKTKLVEFQKFAHNLKQISNYSMINETVYTGPQSIIKVLTSLPPTEHDPFTFTVDLMYFQKNVMILTVTGVFKQPGENLLETDCLYNFMRTFVLREVNDGEYKIINEIMNVTNATSLAQLRSFKVTRMPKPVQVNISLPKNEEERNEIIEAFVILTNMKREWSRKLLKECDFDLKKSLNMFINLFKGDKLPMWAFNSFEGCERLHTPKRPETIANVQPVVITNERTVEKKSEIPPIDTGAAAPTIIEEDAIEEDDELLNDNTDLFTLEGNMSTIQFGESLSRRKSNRLKTLLSRCDKPIVEVLSMSKEVTRDEELAQLKTGIKHITTSRKDNVWYYKLLGLELYRRGFLQEGRDLLDMARTSLTTDNFKVLNDTFLILEIQYGSPEDVDKLVLERINTEPLCHVLDLLTKHAIKAVPCLVRSLFIRMTTYDIPKEKLLEIMIAFHDFELMACTEGMLEKYKELAEKHFPTYNLSSSKVYYKGLPKTLRNTTESGLKDTPNLRSEFRRFRAAILKPVGIYNDYIDDPALSQLLKFSGPDAALLAMCNDLVAKYKDRFVIIKMVSRRLWERNLHDDITKLFETAKEFSNKELLKNLILLYKIKADLLMNKEVKIMDEIKLHVNSISTVQLLNFFEDLANENNPGISNIFGTLLEDPVMNFEKKRLVAFEYKVFSLKLRDRGIMKHTEDLIHNWIENFEAFHYGETLRSLENMPIPFEIDNNTNIPVIASLARRYLEEYSYSFMVGLHVIWLYFLRNLRKLARETRKLCLLKLAENKDLHLKFSIISLMLEAKYGDKNRALRELNLLENTNSKNMNYICPLAECHVLNKRFDEARNILLPRMSNLSLILDPEIQKVLFLYFYYWKKQLKVDVLKEILPSEKSPKPTPQLNN